MNCKNHWSLIGNVKKLNFFWFILAAQTILQNNVTPLINLIFAVNEVKFYMMLTKRWQHNAKHRHNDTLH